MSQQPSNRAVDLVGVFDDDFNQLFPDARPLLCTVREDAQLMDHPVESGATITDHRIMLPVEINLSLMLSDPANDYEAVKSLYREASLVTVQTRTSTYPNMLIAALPHEESSDVFDKTPLSLVLREVQLVEAQFQALPPRQVDAPRDASTAKRGQKSTTTEQPAADGEKKSSTLYRIFNGG